MKFPRDSLVFGKSEIQFKTGNHVFEESNTVLRGWEHEKDNGISLEPNALVFRKILVRKEITKNLSTYRD